jgi:nucleoside-diphosphate-sugar epimerase
VSSNFSPIIAGDLAEIIGRDLPWSQLFGATVLVTGASGMLGSYAIRTLLALNDTLRAGITVLALARNERTASTALSDVLHRNDASLIVQDVRTPLAVDGPLDFIIHAAGVARPAMHGADPVGTMTGILLGSFNLLELCIAKGSRTFVLLSSAEIYGWQPQSGAMIGEEGYGGLDTLSPRACYSEGKRAAETLSVAYQAQHGIRSLVARFGHVYGPGLTLEDGRVQADFAANILSNSNIVLNSDGAAVRTYTYVGDAIAGMFYALLLGREVAYNIADENGLVSIRDLVGIFVSSSGVLAVRG